MEHVSVREHELFHKRALVVSLHGKHCSNRFACYNFEIEANVDPQAFKFGITRVDEISNKATSFVYYHSLKIQFKYSNSFYNCVITKSRTNLLLLN
jgi:hypothetical protein